jgi:hypothetical protein
MREIFTQPAPADGKFPRFFPFYLNFYRAGWLIWVGIGIAMSFSELVLTAGALGVECADCHPNETTTTNQ